LLSNTNFFKGEPLLANETTRKLGGNLQGILHNDRTAVDNPAISDSLIKSLVYATSPSRPGNTSKVSWSMFTDAAAQTPGLTPQQKTANKTDLATILIGAGNNKDIATMQLFLFSMAIRYVKHNNTFIINTTDTDRDIKAVPKAPANTSAKRLQNFLNSSSAVKVSN
jgi:hypothetical protein